MSINLYRSLMGLTMFLICLGSCQNGRLEELVTTDSILSHLAEFQKIADFPSNLNSRAVHRGYNDSVNYVLGRLRETNLRVWTQTLPAPISEEVLPPVLRLAKPVEVQFELNSDFLTYSLSVGGTVEASIQFVLGGCSLADFDDFRAGSIALLNRGTFNPSGYNGTTCAYRDLIDNAIRSGASGVLVYNPNDLLPTLGGTNNAQVPVFGVSSAVANLLMQYPASGFTTEVVVRMISYNQMVTYTTLNVFAETLTGNPDLTIVVGAHLDSVPPGPGINDNGSGSAAILEAALQFGNLNTPVNRVRFSWWAGEEWGLYGSHYYVDNLSEEEKAQIALNLNYDMIGSPNFFRGIYNGEGAVEEIRPGCVAIQRLFEDYFNQRNMGFETTPFDGRSDYGPFIEALIPAGGLFTGAEVKKTIEQRDKYGGMAYVSFDPAYHLFADSLTNINVEALESMGGAAVSVLETLAFEEDLAGFLGRQSKKNSIILL